MGHVKSATQLATELRQIYERADLSKRDLTASERSEVEDLNIQTKSQKAIEDIGRELGGGLPEFMRGDGSPGGQFGYQTPGEAFVNSAGWKAISDPQNRPQQWSTGPVQVSDVALSTKGTLLEGVGAPGSGTGGGLVPVPMVENGLVATLFQPLSVVDLLPQSQVDTSVVRYMLEGTAVSAAAGVAEAGVKPESTIGVSTVDEQVKKNCHDAHDLG
jgi:hypothetical protein